MKKWITSVMETLEASLRPVSHEINELDWKQSLSPKKERLMQHLSAFANHPSGGVLVFGIDNQTAMPNGIQQDEAAIIVGQIANLGRDALEPPVAFEEGENYFKVTLFAPRKFSEMSQMERIEACYQHAVLKYLSSSAMTNTSLRERLKMHEKQRTQVSNLIRDAIDAGRIKRKDPTSASVKFAEYIPYWV